jgi:hypothetical protein
MISSTYLHNGKRCAYSQRPAWSYRAARRNLARQQRRLGARTETVSGYMDRMGHRWHGMRQTATAEG